jgi:hypothetical protein
MTGRPAGASHPWPAWGWAAASGVIGAALWAIGWTIEPPARVLGAWLAAFVFWLGLPLGAVALIMIHDLVGGAWGNTLRRPLAAIAATLPIFALIVIPVLAGVSALYPWARPVGPGASSAPGNAWYLDPVFFVARTAIYFAIWIALMRVARRPLDDQYRVRSAAAGLILFALTVTFASFDWMSSLDPEFNSSAYGMMVGIGVLTSGLAAAVLIAARRIPDTQTLSICGNLLLTGVLLWAYVAFMQFLIVWEENLTDEIPWYMRRLAHGWQLLAAIVVIGHFVLPFLLLLWRRVKASRLGLPLVCGMLLLAHLLDIWWLVLPDLMPAAGPGWSTPAATLAIGGAAIAFAMWRDDRVAARRQPLAELHHG